MLTNLSLAILFSLTPHLAESQAVPFVGATVYFLDDASNQQWCAYKSETQWKADIQFLTAMRVGTVEYTNNRIVTVKFTKADETGDFVVYDTYSLDKDEKIERLKRTMNVVPDTSVEQAWLIRNGVATMQRSEYRSLSTGRPVSPNLAVELPGVAIITKPQAFPFWRLIRDRIEEVSSKGKVCIPE